MATTETLSVPAGENITVDVALKPGQRTQRLSFTSQPETPPETPPNESNSLKGK